MTMTTKPKTRDQHFLKTGGNVSYDDDTADVRDIPALAAMLDKLDKLGSQPHGEHFRKLGQQLVQELGPEDFEKLMSYVSEQDYRRERAAGRE